MLQSRFIAKPRHAAQRSAEPCIAPQSPAPHRKPIVSRSRLNRHPHHQQPYVVKLVKSPQGYVPQRTASRPVALLRHASQYFAAQCHRLPISRSKIGLPPLQNLKLMELERFGATPRIAKPRSASLCVAQQRDPEPLKASLSNAIAVGPRLRPSTPFTT